MVHFDADFTYHSVSEREGPKTLTGVAPGRALYDTPPPDSQPAELKRNQRSRKASARKLEWLESQATSKNNNPRRPSTSKPVRRNELAGSIAIGPIQSQALTDDKDSNQRSGKTPNTGPSRSAADPRSSRSDTQLATVGAPSDSIAFLSKSGVLYNLKERVGHDVSHLSALELENLANSISKSQAASMELTKRNTTAVVDSPTKLDLGGGYYPNRLRDDVVSKPASQSRDGISKPSSQSRKRPPSSSYPPPFKHPCLDDNDANVEDEDEDERERDLEYAAERKRTREREREHDEVFDDEEEDEQTTSDMPNPPYPTDRQPAQTTRHVTDSLPLSSTQMDGPGQPFSLGTTESEHSGSEYQAAGQPILRTTQSRSTPAVATRPTHTHIGTHVAGSSPHNPTRPQIHHPGLLLSLGTTESEQSDSDDIAAGQSTPRTTQPRSSPVATRPAHTHTPATAGKARTGTSQTLSARAANSSAHAPTGQPLINNPGLPPSLGTTESEHSDSDYGAAGQRSPRTTKSRSTPTVATLPVHTHTATAGKARTSASQTLGAPAANLSPRSPAPPPSLGTTESEQSDLDDEAEGQPTPHTARYPRPPSNHATPNPKSHPRTVRDDDFDPPDDRTPFHLTDQAASLRPSGRHPYADAAPRDRETTLISDLMNPDVQTILQWALKLAERQSRDDQHVAAGGSTSGAGSTRHRSASFAPPVFGGVRGQTGGPPSSRSSTHDPFEFDAEAPQGAKAAAAGSKQRKQTGLGDYSSIHKDLAKRVVPVMLVKGITLAPYGTNDDYCNWAEEAFEDFWESEGALIAYKSPPRSYLKVLVRRPGNFRTSMKMSIRPGIGTIYKFIKAVVLEEIAEGNRALAKKLAARFYYGNVDKALDPYEHPAISRAIADAYFTDAKALGIHYPSEFNPIPLPAVALVLTIMQFCISEWESGHHGRLELDADEQQPIYEAHLAGLHRYAKKSSDRLLCFRKAWFKFGMDSVADAKKAAVFSQPVLPDEHIRLPTPLGHEGHVKYSSRKGKGKAVGC